MREMELIDEILADKAAGTRRLVAEYGARLHETALRLCGNAADAEDYTFRTLERAVGRIHLFSRKSSLFTWLYEIMANLIRTDARRLGYRFFPQKVTWPDAVKVGKNGETFEVSFSFVNRGVAPCYRNAYPCLTVKDDKGRIIAVLADDGFNLKGLLPVADGT